MKTQARLSRASVVRKLQQGLPTVALGMSALLALVAGGPTVAVARATEVIETTSGPVRGAVNGDVESFLGIRYAASPEGSNRWLPPQPPTPSKTVVDATTPGNACPQIVNQFSPPAAFPQSEDCLFLNVWRPADRDEDRHDGDRAEGDRHDLPVLIWIHGGALVNGTGAGFDPTLMVESGKVIVVTINYRLGALGWLAAAALGDAGGNSGNYGLMDQQLAMTWVRNNIARFGGDPDRTTISGESAGGLSTLSNLASPPASGLFRQAIVESGAYMIFSILPLAKQEALGALFEAKVNCTTGNSALVASCVRKVPVATLLAQQGVINTAPTSGVPTLPQGLSQAFASGNFNRVPVLQGTNLNEGTLFEPFAFDPTFTFVPGGAAQGLIAGGKLTYAQEVGLFFPAVPAVGVTFLAGLYPPASFPNPDSVPPGAPSADAALGQIFTDLVFTCHGLTANQLLAKFVPVYAYEFADPNAPDLFQPLIGFSYGASHASELQYLFDAKTLQGSDDAAANAKSPAPGASVQPPTLNAAQQELARQMKTYWTNFVRSGTPNSSDHNGDRDDVPSWPLFDAQGDVQSLVTGPAQPHPITTFATEHNCTALTPFLGG
jgi:para-nitrobenzyl esterase